MMKICPITGMPEDGLPPNPKQAYGDKKVPVGLVPPSAIMYAGLAFKEGARKYGPYNWRETAVEAMTYVHALQRHMMAWVDGENIDEESGNPHLAHAIACLCILIDAYTCGNLIDNRPPEGRSGELLRAASSGTEPVREPEEELDEPAQEPANITWNEWVQKELQDERWVPPVVRPEPRPLNPRFDHACPDLDQEYPPCSCPLSHCLAETIGSGKVYEFIRGHYQPQRMQCARQRFDVV